jgi:ArsR family transcriptional regulator
MKTDALIQALRAVAEPTRLEIIGLLAGRRGGETPTWVLEQLGHRLSQPTVSHHLRVLHHAGVLDRRVEPGGPVPHVYYAVSTAALARLADAIGGLR